MGLRRRPAGLGALGAMFYGTTWPILLHTGQHPRVEQVTIDRVLDEVLRQLWIWDQSSPVNKDIPQKSPAISVRFTGLRNVAKVRRCS
jgi:hypothetical protein